MDSSLGQTVVSYMDGFTVKLLQKNLNKTNTYKADSYKTGTFLGYQMKILTKKLPLKRKQDRIKK